MVFRRRQFARPRTTRRPRAVRRTFVRKVARVVNRMSETKRTEVRRLSDDFFTLSSSWSEKSYTTPTYIPVGTSSLARIGTKIAITGFYLQGTLAGGQANTALDDRVNTVRMILGLWTSSTPMATIGTPNPMDAPLMRNFNSGGLLLRKFMDRRISLVSPGKDSTGYMTAQRLVKIYYKFRKPIAIDYSAATVNRNLVLSIVSDSSAVPSPGFTSGFVYLTFKDF